MHRLRLGGRFLPVHVSQKTTELPAQHAWIVRIKQPGHRRIANRAHLENDPVVAILPV